MSKILIALYMGFLAGCERHAQGPNYGNQRGNEGRCRQLEDYDPFHGFDCAQTVGGSFANKKYQKGNHTATDNGPIRNGA